MKHYIYVILGVIVLLLGLGIVSQFFEVASVGEAIAKKTITSPTKSGLKSSPTIAGGSKTPVFKKASGIKSSGSLPSVKPTPTTLPNPKILSTFVLGTRPVLAEITDQSQRNELLRLYCFDLLRTLAPYLGETDVDCGGPCKPCADDDGCRIDADCGSGVCLRDTRINRDYAYREDLGRCAPPSCSDRVRNGRETGVDCGGDCPVCRQCADTDRGSNGIGQPGVYGEVDDLLGIHGVDRCIDQARGEEAFCDAKGLLIYSEFNCPSGTLCSTQVGRCVPLSCAANPTQCDTPPPACRNICTVGTTRCAGNNMQACADFNGDGCTEWEEFSCPAADSSCQNGACSPTTPVCQGECTSGVAQCGGAGVQVCGNYDADSCTEWNLGTACAAGQACQNGACVVVPPDETCTDDDGENVRLVTTAFDSHGARLTDYCASATTVKEGVCGVDRRATTKDIACAEGEQCLSGICVPNDICSQPDPTVTYPESRVIRTDVGFHLNQCADTSTMMSIICRDATALPYVGLANCANGCLNGGCLSQSIICQDSDPTNDVSEPGIAFRGEELDIDRCTDWWRISQVQCSSNPLGRFLHSEAECPEGTFCMTRRLSSPIENNNRFDVGRCGHYRTICQENGGIAELTLMDLDAGQTRTDYYWSGCNYWDYGAGRPRRGSQGRCINDDSRPAEIQATVYIDEFSCGNNEVCIVDRTAPSLCVPDTGQVLCTDTDGGVNLQQQGYLNNYEGSRGTADDICNFRYSNFINEHSCGPEGQWRSETLPCPSGQFCAEGACRTNYDSDPPGENYPNEGGDPFTAGEVRCDNVFQPDVCLGEGGTELMQYECGDQPNTLRETRTTCPSGTTCTLGKCS